MYERDLTNKQKPDLLGEINPEMSPEEVIKRLKLFNDLDYNETHESVFKARNQLLIKAGYNPNDWVFHTNKSHIYEDMTIGEELDNFYGKHFPPGIEFLAFQGQFTGGVRGEQCVLALTEYRYIESGYTVFIRSKPKMLPEDLNG